MADALLDVDRVIGLKTVREATSRGLFLSAIRELGKDSGEFTLARLQELMRVEEHFQALLLYDQIDFLRQPASASDGDRDFALNIQRICLEAANGFQRFLRNRNTWATTREALDTMFRVTGLALNSIHSFVKWGYFLNEPGRATPWKQVHALYALAEADGYSRVPFVLHAPQPSYKPSVTPSKLSAHAASVRSSPVGTRTLACSRPVQIREGQLTPSPSNWLRAHRPGAGVDPDIGEDRIPALQHVTHQSYDGRSAEITDVCGRR
jgi:hypothetical protein